MRGRASAAQRESVYGGVTHHAFLFQRPELVLLPIGHRMARILGLLPLLAGAQQGILVGPVEQDADPLVGPGIRRQVGALDQEPDRGGVRIYVPQRQHHRLARRIGLAVGAVRQEALVGIGPEVVVQRLQTLLARRLDRGLPAAVEGALDEVRQHLFQRLALHVVEENLCHGPRI